MPPLPKRKLSSHRQGRRRRNIRLDLLGLTACPHCHQPKRPHYHCPHCHK